MAAMPHFHHHQPATLEELLELMGRYGPDARIIAGGTDLIPKLRGGALSIEHLVSIRSVQELDHIGGEDGGLVIGAGARIGDVGAHPLVRERYPALAEACSVMATTQIRNMATVAGNLANGSPCADTAGPLLVYAASVVLAERGAEREIELRDFWDGPGEVKVKRTEIVRAIRVPPPPQGCGSAYLRLSARSKVDIAAVSVAGLVTLDDGRIADARLALGAVAPTPMRCSEAEQALAGAEPEGSLLARAATACAEASRPIDDVRATAAYRRLMVEVLAKRVLERCVGGAR